ncbi:MAG: type II toxin-antitoxin system prevent-host-death family antitoxin [Victivallales bacterium]|jgi:prevent-host-death family protein
MDMKTANVAILKQNLSAYLRLVEQGDEVVVTSHRRQIARLIPESGSRLAIRPPSMPLSTLASVRGVKALKAVSAGKMLLADRGRR